MDWLLFACVVGVAIPIIYEIAHHKTVEKTPGKRSAHRRHPHRSSTGRVAAKRKSGSCDGNCDKCPAHYGYRFGRWYYGHGHQRGCERGGNGGRTGKCTRM